MSIEDIILNNWLNNNYKFEPKITDIKNDFKNGFKFGELLYKFELISDEDFNLYQNSDNNKDIEANYSLLQKDLKELFNFKLDQEEIDDIINNKNINKIVILLYRIKNSYYKYKIHFADIKDFLVPMKQNELNEKVKLLLESSNINEMYKNDESDDNISHPKEIIKNPRKIKIHKLGFIKENISLTKEKTFMNKIILPKIKKYSKNFRNQNCDNNKINIKEKYKLEKIPVLNKNKSEINIFEYSPITLDDIRKKHVKFKLNNENQLDLTEKFLKAKNSVNNIFEKRINIMKSKGLNTERTHNVSEPEYNFIKKDKLFMNKIYDKLSTKKNGYYLQEKNFNLFKIGENSKYKSASKRKE